MKRISKRQMRLAREQRATGPPPPSETQEQEVRILGKRLDPPEPPTSGNGPSHREAELSENVVPPRRTRSLERRVDEESVLQLHRKVLGSELEVLRKWSQMQDSITGVTEKEETLLDKGDFE